jgi:hypothetical protein
MVAITRIPRNDLSGRLAKAFRLLFAVGYDGLGEGR